MSNEARERLRELICDQALWGLDGSQTEELETLRSDWKAREPDFDVVNDLEEDLEGIAALAAVALLPRETEKVPDALAKQLEAEALGFVAARQGLAPESVLEALDTVKVSGGARVENEDAESVSFVWISFAAAAAILVALWVDGFRKQFGDAPNELPSQARERLLADSTDLFRMQWKKGPSEFAGAASGEAFRGDVVWSDALQTGFMRFRDLPVNDAERRQYQLWIFDETRDDAQPVDGGVFDVVASADGDAVDIVVPIRAALRVGGAKAFAVTVEEPGGVVVSRREHIVATAGL